MNSDRLQFYALYLTRFASSFGMVTLVTLLPTYINLYDPSGLVIGLFTTALTVSQTLSVVPLAWVGDRYDKRTVLLGGLGVSILTYLLFPLVSSSETFVLVRFLQGVGLVGTGMISLALIGELAPSDRRANYIGRYNAWRMAAGIGGALSAGLLYELVGFAFIYHLLVVLLAAAAVGVWYFIDPDETSVGGFAFSDLAVNRRVLTLTSFRAPYAVAVTLVRNWVPVYAGVTALHGGLGYSAFVVSVVITAEKVTNMTFQPFFGRLSDRVGRAAFVFVGGGLYGLVALAVPFAPAVGAFLSLPSHLPVLGELTAAFLPLVLLNGLLGLADSLREPASMGLFADVGNDAGGIASSFGLRGLVWRPGSILAPLLGGFLMTQVGIQWVFFVGGVAALAGVSAFVGILSHDFGRRALVEW